ncbi:MAG: glycoside hydrolase family 3 C-terminal domain-containing protein [Bacteroidota bacterium]
MDDLVGRMTLDEKAKQTLYNAPAIERLGVPGYNWWNEALHGVARAGRATVFPQAIGLAAMWDSGLMFRVATAISDEARAKHHDAARKGRRGIYEGLTFWSPNINIFRDPRWGRGMETFGEDPYLTGRLAVEFVKGMQGDHPYYFKTIATPKHFAVHSGPEPERHVFDAVVGERDLRETYLPAFRMAVVDGKAYSVMCAYNRFRGAPCCGSDHLLEKILRGEWGFDGYVVSDCWAIQDFYQYHEVVGSAPEAAAMALRAGTDLNCGVTYDSLGTAIQQGLVSEELLDRSVKRLFRARFRLGMFDPTKRVPFADTPIEVNDSEQHRQLALEAAHKSIVLLKNDGGLLPLSKNIRSIAVIGPNADEVEVLLGNYNGTPSEPVTLLEGIRKKVDASTTVFFSRGCEIAEKIPFFDVVPPSALAVETEGVRISGLKGEYFRNTVFSGAPALVRVDPSIDFTWWEGPPGPSVEADSFSVRWTGWLIPSISGAYDLGVTVLGEFRLFLDDSLVTEVSALHGTRTQTKRMDFEAGVPRRIRVEYWDRRADGIVKLVWSPPHPSLEEEALAAARKADVVVLVLGLSPRLEGEEMPISIPGFAGGDRTDIRMPEVQEKLMKRIAGLGKPVALILLNGSALGIEWAAEHIPAIVEAWYPGQAAGTALADVLFGDYNPAGRLPVTFYRSVDQLPPFNDYAMAGRTYRYFSGEPLFPFGYGLSYTTFEYSNLQTPRVVQAGGGIEVTVDVRNSGLKVGEEVVQLYVTDIEASVPVPVRSLQGFKRVRLSPGEGTRVTFSLEPRQLSLIDPAGRRMLEPGIFEISVGGGQPAMQVPRWKHTSGVVAGRMEVRGEPLRVPE